MGELNALEREFLRVTDWDLCVSRARGCYRMANHAGKPERWSRNVLTCLSKQVPAELIQQYYSSLIRSHGGFVQSSPPEKSPFTIFPLEGPSKVKPRKSNSADDHERKSGDDDDDVGDRDGGMDVDGDGVEDEVRIRSGQTGATEQEVVEVLMTVLKGEARLSVCMPQCYFW